MIEPYYYGLLAQFILAISIIPYVISTFKGTVRPNPISWFIWSIIGFAFWMITPESADRVTKMLTIIFMINPTIIFTLTLFKGKKRAIDTLEWVSLLVGVSALSIWYFFRETSGMFPISMAIAADFCALIPTLRFVLNAPSDERPFAWICFFFGTFIALFGIEQYTIESLALPLYMTLGALSVMLPLVYYRIKHRIPLQQWII